MSDITHDRCAISTTAVGTVWALSVFIGTDLSPSPAFAADNMEASQSALPGPLQMLDLLKLDNNSTNPRVLAPIPVGDNWTLQPGGFMEMRFEHRVNHNMQHPVDGPTHDSPIFLYTFLNAALENKDKNVKMFFEGYNTHSSNYESTWNPHENVELDIFQAWLEYKFQGSPWSVKIGRQAPPKLGDARLVGPPAYWRWTVPDGITIQRITKEMETTILAYSTNTFVGVNDDKQNYASELRPTNSMIWGIYNTWKLPNKYEFDLYNLNRNSFNEEPYVSGSDGVEGRLENYGFGSRLRGPIYSNKDVGTWAWGTEGTLQVGRWGGGTLLSYMFHADTSWEWAKPWKPKVSLFTNVASGTQDPTSNSYNRFDSLLGPSHYGYGMTDMFRLANLNEVGVSFQVKPTEKTTVLTGLHQFWLNSASDAWIAADQRVIAWDKSGKSGNDLGQEINLLVQHKINAHWSMEAGAAYLFTGEFGANTGHGANSSIVYFDQSFSF